MFIIKVSIFTLYFAERPALYRYLSGFFLFAFSNLTRQKLEGSHISYRPERNCGRSSLFIFGFRFFSFSSFSGLVIKILWRYLPFLNDLNNFEFFIGIGDGSVFVVMSHRNMCDMSGSLFLSHYGDFVLIFLFAFH